MSKKTITFCIMDAPYERSRTVTAFRLMDRALERNNNINVFAYEGAVALSFKNQTAHPNAVHGHDVEQENHPLPKDWIKSLFEKAQSKNLKLDWINCGLCVDERGVNDAVDGCRRGTPGDLWNWASASDNTLIIGTK